MLLPTEKGRTLYLGESSKKLNAEMGVFWNGIILLVSGLKTTTEIAFEHGFQSIFVISRETPGESESKGRKHSESA